MDGGGAKLVPISHSCFTENDQTHFALAEMNPPHTPVVLTTRSPATRHEC